MKKENRLKKRKEFAYIFKKGQSVTSKYVVLVFTSSKLKNFKVGFSAGKKVGKAVYRNKVKRRIKEAVFSYRNNLKSGYNYIFVAKPNSTEATYQDIKSCVEYLLKNANLLVS